MILLMRGDTGYDKVRYKIYRDQVFLLFVTKTTSEYSGWQECTPIPDSLQGVSWKDGDYDQITIYNTEESLQLYRKFNLYK